MIIHHYRRHLWANPFLYLKASFGLHFPVANGKEELLGSPLFTALCPPEGSKEPIICTVVSLPPCKHDLLLLLIIDSECRVVP